MKRLDLRGRLLAAVGVVAILQVVVAFTVVNATRSQLIDQVDERLAIARSPERESFFDGDDPPVVPFDADADRDGDGYRPPERLSDTFEGVLETDGTLRTFFAPNSSGTELAPPAVDAETITAAADGPVTVDASGDDDLHYRLAATTTESGIAFVTAIPLDGVDATMSRVRTVVFATAALITAALALVTWWIIRLGIDPIKSMTRTAEAIAEGDLSERITDTNGTTEAGQLGRALNTMLGRIETSFDERVKTEERLRQFIADASHELRTPVATIRGYAELYRVGGLAETAELDDAMRRTEQESLRMSRLITDMLHLARLDEHPVLRTGPVDLAALIDDAAKDARATQPQRPIDTSVSADCVVDGDEDLLRQVLANVIGNALVHTDGDVPIHLTARRSNGAVVVEIGDDGPGMAPEVAARITERFYRADTSRSRNRGGSGLGLSIVDAAVGAHGGTLTIDSALGEGTTVRLSFPV